MAFSDLLAATIHDMKNSLGLVLSGLEEIDKPARSDTRLQSLRFEAGRLNRQLIQLLAFYKMSQSRLTAHIEEHDVHELLVESLLQARTILEAASLEAEVVADESLAWALDRELISGVLAGAVFNAARHARARLLLHAETHAGRLHLLVNDDGPGFPERLLRADGRGEGSIDFRTGSTGLGLSFAAMIAALHRHGDACGTVTLGNGGPLGGACFTLVLP